MANLTDWLAATFFVDDDAIEDERARDAAQLAILERQRREGKRGLLEYLSLSTGIEGSDLQDYKDENNSLFAVIPWWVWVALIIGVFFYLGGFFWLKNILAPRQ